MILQEQLSLYRESVKNLEQLKIFPASRSWEVCEGIVFAVDTNVFPMYGLISKVNSDERQKTVDFVYLTPHILLASVEAPILRIDDDVFELVKLTHIMHTVPEKELKQVARPVKKVSDVRKVLEHVEKLSNTPYGRIHREFFDTERKFVELVTELVAEFEKIIELPPDLLNSLKSEISELGVAASFGRAVRFGKFILVNTDVGAKVYLDDRLVGKVGKIFIKGKLVFEGKLTNGMILLHLAQFLPFFEEGDIVIEVDENN
ncbi:hypothetical protein [Fervidobacterium thailandense]|uniref:Uncharacterized protein n=1 Tax=Fervidobacterium thailandense TaxID=1008305 RepID=A0A1E3G1G5_9BACT|nr:hypothetical protein [Fervidobacterium thailandense]ODN29990.1 hypothetical protein A4H02_07900 [Fervidobacterium thailandense]